MAVSTVFPALIGVALFVEITARAITQNTASNRDGHWLYHNASRSRGGENGEVVTIDPSDEMTRRPKVTLLAPACAIAFASNEERRWTLSRC